jgi:phosphopantetheinyl transferase
VRALRWLAVEPPVDVTIHATVVGDAAAAGTGGPGAGTARPGGFAVRVTLDGYARGTVVFADAHPPAPAVAGGMRLPGERPAPHTPDDLYRTWMFHGPGYRGMERIDAIAPEGVRGRLVVPPAPGALLDSAGQLFGYWATRFLDADWSLLPQSVAEIRFYGPPPAADERLACVVRIRGVEEKTVVADMELRLAGGGVWAHVVGWTDRRFAADDVLWALMSSPGTAGIGQPTDDGWVLARERWHDTASRDLMMRYYLDARGRPELAARNPRAARGWALGRVAVVDAVRHRLWAAGAGPVWAIEVGIGHTPAGRPVVTALPDRPDVARLPTPRVSLAHKPELAVAIAHPDGEVGIDVERVAPVEPGAERLALADAERRLLDERAGDDADARALWFTYFWSAKEAVAKADGTGLQGRPKRFVVDRLMPAPVAGAAPSTVPGAGAPLLARVSIADAADARRSRRSRRRDRRGPGAAGHPHPVGGTAHDRRHRSGPARHRGGARTRRRRRPRSRLRRRMDLTRGRDSRTAPGRSPTRMTNQDTPGTPTSTIDVSEVEGTVLAEVATMLREVIGEDYVLDMEITMDTSVQRGSRDGEHRVRHPRRPDARALRGRGRLRRLPRRDGRRPSESTWGSARWSNSSPGA